uniref:Putative secreted peptide n=1 Tax=Rhipicephalus pulchellus TaxID=72859 RepID=L7M986_RHIPC
MFAAMSATLLVAVAVIFINQHFVDSERHPYGNDALRPPTPIDNGGATPTACRNQTCTYTTSDASHGGCPRECMCHPTGGNTSSTTGNCIDLL